MPTQRELRKASKALQEAGFHEEAAHFETHADVLAQQRLRASWDKARDADPDVDITEVLDADDIMRLSYDIRVAPLNNPTIRKRLAASREPAAAEALRLMGPEETQPAADPEETQPAADPDDSGDET